MSRIYRVAVLNSHPIQYFAPLYRRLAREPEIDLTVYYCSRQGAEEYLDRGFGKRFKWDIPLLDGYRYEFLPNLWRTDEVAGFISIVNPAILPKLSQGHYDALWLHGHAYASDWLALLAARLTGTAVFYRSESSLTYDRRVRRPLLVRLLKPYVLQLLFSQITCFLSIGTLNRDFYLAHGVPPEKIHHVPYAVDNDYFRIRASEFSRHRRQIRAAMGIGPEDVVFLFAAKMTPKKAPVELLQAYRRMTDALNKALLMIGEGELRATVEAYVSENKLSGVRCLGFVNQSEMAKYYAISDVFVRPDGIYQGDWGLTVNEAMAAGLAIISTNAIGATVDMVRHGKNGLVVKFGDLDALASAMCQMALDPAACRQMGQRSLEIIRKWSYEQCAAGVLSALHSLRS